MAWPEAADDIRLDDGEPLASPVVQILLNFLAVEALKKQPGGVAEVEERFAVLIDEEPTVGADLQLHSFDGPGRRCVRFGVTPRILRRIGLNASLKDQHPNNEKKNSSPGKRRPNR